jgi:chemotaxis family two-component system sensor kinase Cph1
MKIERPSAPEVELEQAREAFREFIYRAAHDLHQYLRAVNASSEMLVGLYADSTDERAIRCRHYIQEGTDRMASLLRDMAAYCDGDGRELQLAETSLNAVLTQVRQQMSDELQKSGAVVTQDPLPTVTCDFFAIATVFHHLIDNACKFRGADAPAIHVGSARHEGEWILSVRDNGVGINPDYADALFQPFKRLHGKEYPGSGLGLALAKRILDQHGGRIWVEPVSGRGSIFSFSLPVD